MRLCAHGIVGFSGYSPHTSAFTPPRYGKDNANESRDKPQGSAMPGATYFRRFTAKIMQTRAETNRKVRLCRVQLIFAVLRQRYLFRVFFKKIHQNYFNQHISAYGKTIKRYAPYFFGLCRTGMRYHGVGQSSGKHLYTPLRLPSRHEYRN